MFLGLRTCVPIIHRFYHYIEFILPIYVLLLVVLGVGVVQYVHPSLFFGYSFYSGILGVGYGFGVPRLASQCRFRA